jgi:hypothetical protein
MSLENVFLNGVPLIEILQSREPITPRGDEDLYSPERFYPYRAPQARYRPRALRPGPVRRLTIEEYTQR